MAILLFPLVALMLLWPPFAAVSVTPIWLLPVEALTVSLPIVPAIATLFALLTVTTLPVTLE
jgi:hypothetical protein